MSRKISWVSSLDPSNDGVIKELEIKMNNFYANNNNYYNDIDFTADNWGNENQICYQQILSACKYATSICEIGCGSANILLNNANLMSKYAGCDFSTELIKRNTCKFPLADFRTIKPNNEFPFEDNSCDLLFSVFVLEHVVRPALFLNECKRVLKEGGRLIIFCPDFLGSGIMSSQQAGWNDGTPRQKLKQGKLLDTLVTFFDNRIRIPLYCYLKRRKEKIFFLINTDPTVFYYKFSVDVDAVYVTNKQEIISYLNPFFDLENRTPQMDAFTKINRLIYLSFIKKNGN